LPISKYEKGDKAVTPDSPIKDRTFAGLKRLPNGQFSDSDLANLLYRATEESAGFFRARGSPVVMKVVDVMGMMQARVWKSVLCFP
jgi:linoleate 10R-lipoxygenase